MRISETGTLIRRCPRPCGAFQHGFSLLEILVVVAIIGIFVGVTVLSTDLVGYERRLEQEAARLGSIVGFASDEALLQSHDFGILVCEDSYHFFIFDQETNDWVPYAARPLEPRALESDTLLTLYIDDREVELERAADEFPSALAGVPNDEELIDMPEPQIIILSSGEVTPFQIELNRASDLDEPGIVLNVAFNGESEVVRSEN